MLSNTTECIGDISRTTFYYCWNLISQIQILFLSFATYQEDLCSFNKEISLVPFWRVSLCLRRSGSSSRTRTCQLAGQRRTRHQQLLIQVRQNTTHSHQHPLTSPLSLHMCKNMIWTYVFLFSSRSQSAAATPSSGGAPRSSSSSSQAPTTPVTPAASAVSPTTVAPTTPGTWRTVLPLCVTCQLILTVYIRLDHFLFDCQLLNQPRLFWYWFNMFETNKL